MTRPLKYIFAFIFTLLPVSAFAEISPFEPVNGGLDLVAAATSIKEHIHDLHLELLYIIFAISIFVLGLLIYTVIRYHRRNNPTPSTTTHHMTLEIVWTVIPVLILLAIGYPSIKLIYYQDRIPESELTIKTVGHQWYWSYEYPDSNIAFDARPLWDTPQTTDEQARAAAAEARANWLLNNGDPRRLLETDNRVVVPVDTTVRVLITGADVIHAWAVPAFGVKRDAMPGKLNETWFKAEHEGVFYGQCSEICGTGHGFMPIAIEVVSKEKFAAWLEDAKKRFASNQQTPALQTIVAQR